MARIYGGEAKDERAGRRRAALVDAAASLIAEAGWRNLRVEHVCRRAGLAKRYFYESFAGLDDLTAAVVDRIATEMMDAVLAAVDTTQQPPRTATRAGIDALVGHLAADQRRARVLFGEASSSEAATVFRADAVARMSAAVNSIAVALDSRFRDTNLDTVVPSSFVVGGIIEAVTSWLDGELGVTRERLVDELTDLVVGAGRTVVARHRAVGRRFGA